jgi:hypothetical protein
VDDKTNIEITGKDKSVDIDLQQPISPVASIEIEADNSKDITGKITFKF